MIKAENEFSSNADSGVLFDGSNVPGLTSTGANCNVGFTLTQPSTGAYSKKAIVSEFRFFMDFFTNKALYAGVLQLQGSNDAFAAETVTLVTVGEEIHEGWNSFSLTGAAYSSYRIFNPTAGGCNAIGELNFFGQVAFVFPTTATCDVKVLDVASQTEFDITQTVEYQLGLTSYVESIVPRFGSVEGGTAVTITTTSLGTTNVADVTVTIDGIDCPIDSLLSTQI